LYFIIIYCVLPCRLHFLRNYLVLSRHTRSLLGIWYCMSLFNVIKEKTGSFTNSSTFLEVLNCLKSLISRFYVGYFTSLRCLNWMFNTMVHDINITLLSISILYIYTVSCRILLMWNKKTTYCLLYIDSL